MGTAQAALDYLAGVRQNHDGRDVYTKTRVALVSVHMSF